MNRFSRSLSGLTAGALFLLFLVSCAGGAEHVEDEGISTSSEVVSAEFPGGAAAVIDFIAGKVSYPESAKADGVEGKVFVEFTISEDGSVTNARVKESLHPALDSAAVAAAMSMPAWAPATKGGTPVATTITLPVMFRLD